MLQDNSFRWFMRLSTDVGGADTAKKATPVRKGQCCMVKRLHISSSFHCVCVWGGTHIVPLVSLWYYPWCIGQSRGDKCCSG